MFFTFFIESLFLFLLNFHNPFLYFSFLFVPSTTPSPRSGTLAALAAARLKTNICVGSTLVPRDPLRPDRFQPQEIYPGGELRKDLTPYTLQHDRAAVCLVGNVYGVDFPLPLPPLGNHYRMYIFGTKGGGGVVIVTRGEISYYG